MDIQSTNAGYAICITSHIKTKRKITAPELDKFLDFLYIKTKEMNMWPFKKKESKKNTENIELQNLTEKTYTQLKHEYNVLEIENAEKEDQCAKEGDTWQEMLIKTKGIKEKMAHIDKMMRKIQEPSLIYNKKWKGRKMELEDFIAASIAKDIADMDGEGYYATETAKTDIRIYPSDIIENIYRTEFPYVLWIPSSE